jgi:hypothetical protein
MFFRERNTNWWGLTSVEKEQLNTAFRSYDYEEFKTDRAYKKGEGVSYQNKYYIFISDIDPWSFDDTNVVEVWKQEITECEKQFLQQQCSLVLLDENSDSLSDENNLFLT